MIPAQMVITDGGMGDLIAELVAVNYNVRTNPGVHWKLFCPDYLRLLARHLIPGLDVYPFSEANLYFDKTALTKSTDWSPSGHSPMHTHPVDYGFHMLADRHMEDPVQKSYLQIRPEDFDHGIELPNRYVCIAATGAVPCKTLPAIIIDEIASFCLSRGATPVFMGKRESQTGVKGLAVTASHSGCNTSVGIDLIDKTGPLQAARIISDADAFVGMDGGLMHLAGCTTTPIVAGFTLVSPEQVAPYRSGSQKFKFHAAEPDEGIFNRYYQSRVGVAAPGDRRFFPGWEKVLASLTADKFIKLLSPLITML